MDGKEQEHSGGTRTVTALAALLLSCALPASSAPDLSSRNSVDLGTTYTDSYEMFRAIATEGAWTAAAGNLTYDGQGTWVSIYGRGVTLTGPWDGTGASVATINSPNYTQEFGASLAMHGNRLAVGSPAEWEEDIRCSDYYCYAAYEELADGGRIWLYEYNGSEFQLAREIPYGDLNDRFGQDVAVTEGLLLGGAPGAVPGEAHLIDPETGSHVATFTSPDGTGSDRFGFKVALTANLALVAAPGSATVYAYRNNGAGTWLESGALASPGIGSLFGASLAINGNRIAVGAPGSGAAYIFEDTGGEDWPVSAELTGNPDSEFGYQVAIEGSTVWVSAPSENVNDETQGRIYQYEQQPAGGWLVSNNYESKSPSHFDQFGIALAASADILTTVSRLRRDAHNHRAIKDVFTSADRIVDSDEDTVSDLTDNCPQEPNTGQANLDRDSLGDICDNDIDGDGVSNEDEDVAGTDPLNPDTDGDGYNDRDDPYPLLQDGDDDGHIDTEDNCTTTANPSQDNTDGDRHGDACDPDIDNDSIPNEEELANGTDPYRFDTDGDGISDLVDIDPLDFRNGWNNVYRFELPDVFTVATGGNFVLAATRTGLYGYAPVDGEWQAAAGPPIKLQEDEIIVSIAMHGPRAAISTLRHDISPAGSVKIFDRQADGSWWLFRDEYASNYVSELVVGDDVVVSVAPVYPDVEVTIRHYTQPYGYVRINSYTVDHAYNPVIQGDWVIASQQYDDTLNFFPISGGPFQSILHTRRSRIGRTLAGLEDGRVYATGLKDTTSGSVNTVYWLEQRPSDGAWYVQEDSEKIVPYGAGYGRNGVAFLTTARYQISAFDLINGDNLGTFFDRNTDPRYGFDTNGAIIAQGNSGRIDIFLIDRDGDTVADVEDNCPQIPNPNQTDSDGDGVGNFCEIPPGCL